MPPGISNTSSFLNFPDAAEKKQVIEEFQGDLVFNGINGATGKYALQPMSAQELAGLIEGKPYHENMAIRQALEDKQPGLQELQDAQWARLLDNITDERQALLESLDEEKVTLFVTLAQKPWTYDTLLKTQSEIFAGLDEAEVQHLTDQQQELLDKLSQKEKQTLVAGLTEEQQQRLQQMLDELLTAFEQEQFQGELNFKQQSYAISAFPTTPDVEDPTDIAQAGWGIIFPAAMQPAKVRYIQEALGELLQHRQKQTGKLFKLYAGPDGYRAGEIKSKFLQRHGVGAGLADPQEMPFYILLIGSPEEIPYEFEDQLDVMRGVGRLDFDDDYEAYAQYAHNVVMAETGQVNLPRRATFFGVANPDDNATQLSARYLIQPLLDGLDPKNEDKINVDYTWQTNAFIGPGQATKKQLKTLLGSDPDQTPALLLTASHGMEFPKGDGRQIVHQGALLCQDWPGPKGKLQRDHYFAGQDLDPQANVLGMVAIFFACYGAGTPRLDQFAMQAFKDRKPIAPYGFVAELPKQLLQKGALAVLGHVERAWGYSFVKPDGSLDNTHFKIAVQRLLNGDPIGWATDPGFDLRYADMSSELSQILENRKYGDKSVSDHELAQIWTANNDARSYVIIGDPAVRIPFVKDDEVPIERPPLEKVSVDVGSAPPEDSTQEAYRADAATLEAGQSFALQVDDLTTSLKNFSDKIAQAVKDATDDILNLDVETYATGDLPAITQGNTADRQLRAFTRVRFDGDMENYVPTSTGGGIDQELWQIHMDMVREAQVNRAQFIGAMAEMATNLLKNLNL